MKLDLRDRVQAVVFAYELGLVEPAPVTRSRSSVNEDAARLLPEDEFELVHRRLDDADAADPSYGRSVAIAITLTTATLGETMKLLRNLMRRKLRTVLTISGITIGIWALVVFGSMANKINALVDGGSQYFGNKIVVSDARAAASAPRQWNARRQRPWPRSTAWTSPFRRSPSCGTTEGGGGFSVPGSDRRAGRGRRRGPRGLRPQLRSGPPAHRGRRGQQRRRPGADLARKHSVRAGDTIDLRGVDFEIVGVLEPTLTAPDTTAMVPAVGVPAAASTKLFRPIVREQTRAGGPHQPGHRLPGGRADIEAARPDDRGDGAEHLER